MTDKRTPDRLRKRMPLQYGIEECNRVAFTEDISQTGLFIRAANVCVPNTRITVRLTMEDDQQVMFDARVVWAKKVPNNLFHLVRKSGMGVRILRFHDGEERYRAYCDQLSRNKAYSASSQE